MSVFTTFNTSNPSLINTLASFGGTGFSLTGDELQSKGQSSDLVPELRELICAQCTPDQLASLSLSNTNWKAEAERALYRTIGMPSTRPMNMLDQCVQTLTTNLNKASLVHSLAVCFPEEDVDYDSSAELHTVVQIMDICHALRNTVSLKFLSFHTQSRWSRQHVKLIESLLQ